MSTEISSAGNGNQNSPWGPRTTGVLVEIYTGVDNAHELVLEFIDLVSERGQFDLLAGAKVSFDADAVLVSEG